MLTSLQHLIINSMFTLTQTCSTVQCFSLSVNCCTKFLCRVQVAQDNPYACMHIQYLLMWRRISASAKIKLWSVDEIIGLREKNVCTIMETYFQRQSQGHNTNILTFTYLSYNFLATHNTHILPVIEYCQS